MKYRPTFVLKDSRLGKSSIIVAVYFAGQRLRFATGQSVDPSHWSSKRQRVKAGDPLAAPINDRLDEIERNLGKAIAAAQSAGELSATAIRKRFEEMEQAPVPAKTRDFFKDYEKWIGKQEITVWTAKNHTKAKNHLKAFAESRHMTLTYSDLATIALWKEFVTYLLRTKKLTTESTWNVIKSIKWHMTSTFRNGDHKYDVRGLVTRKELRDQLPKVEPNSDHVFLTEHELDVLQELDLSDAPRLERVRDLFVFLCFSGLRYSDSQQVTSKDRQGNLLKLVTIKNKSRATIPLLPQLVSILDCYNGRLPRISNQKGNLYLQLVLERAAEHCESLKAPVTEVRYRGAERIETVRKKYQAMGLHTGRRTFISLSLSRGVSLESLAKTTGNTLETLKTYDVRSSEEAAAMVRDAWENPPKERKATRRRKKEVE